jgi:hypothetical protein
MRLFKVNRTRRSGAQVLLPGQRLARASARRRAGVLAGGLDAALTVQMTEIDWHGQERYSTV